MMKAERPLKIIVTSMTRLVRKYGQRSADVHTQLERLARSDDKRGIDTHILYMDDTKSCKALKLKPSVKVTPQTCKAFIDAMYKAHQPAYIVLFGAGDVFPFIELTNPVKSEEDPDPHVPSDLPYACSGPFKTSPAAFKNPSRVVGRLPDLPGHDDGTYLPYVKKLVDTIIAHKPKDLKDYQDKFFALSAGEWQVSSETTASTVFGRHDGMLVSPPVVNTKLTAASLKPLAHFINCHGDLNDPTFTGQLGDEWPTALHEKDLHGRVQNGTMVAAECCYGAQLFNNTDEGRSIASSYLGLGAITFLGSSTIAYGDTHTQSCADHMCEYFMSYALQGASTGRAFLEARQKYLSKAGHLDGHEQKTIAQFILLGDPSIDLIKPPRQGSGEDTVSNRREKLVGKAAGLNASVQPARRLTKAPQPVSKAEVVRLMEEHGFAGVSPIVYQASGSPGPAKGRSKRKRTGKVYFRTYAKLVGRSTPTLPLRVSLKEYTAVPTVEDVMKKMSKRFLEPVLTPEFNKALAAAVSTALVAAVASGSKLKAAHASTVELAPTLSQKGPRAKAVNAGAVIMPAELVIEAPRRRSIKVLVVKEGEGGVLGWRTYTSR